MSEISKEMIEAVAQAVEDAEIGYSINLTRLVDGESTYTLRYQDGTPTLEFGSYDEASEHVGETRGERRARAVISALSSLPAIGEGSRAEGLEEAARLIEASIIKETSAGKVLAPRQEGNRDGLHYAEAIRSLSALRSPPEPVSMVEGEAAEIIRGFLSCPEIADCAPEDLDNETRDLERRARRFLASPPSDGELVRMRETLREFDCPRPCNGRPDDFTVGQCVDAGECGCGARAALSAKEA
jgi:hypothetical protein